MIDAADMVIWRRWSSAASGAALNEKASKTDPPRGATTPAVEIQHHLLNSSNPSDATSIGSSSILRMHTMLDETHDRPRRPVLSIPTHYVPFSRLIDFVLYSWPKLNAVETRSRAMASEYFDRERTTKHRDADGISLVPDFTAGVTQPLLPGRKNYAS